MTRNQSIDFFKLFAAVSVVMIHSAFFLDGELPLSGINQFGFYFGRFAVPFFFICSGYLLHNNDRALLNVTKLYIIYATMYGIVNFFYLNIFSQRVIGVVWYFTSYMLILVLTQKKTKNWTFFLFLISILYLILSGHTFIPYNSPLFIIDNNAINFLWLFIVSGYIKKIDYKVSTHLRIPLLIICLIVILFNGLVLHFEQYELFNMLLALILFISIKDLNITSKRDFSHFSTDIFVFHGFFLALEIPFGIYKDQFFFLIIGMIVLASIASGHLLRFFSTRYFEGKLYP